MSATEASGNIRSISRGLSVLKVVNRHRSLTMMQIAKISGVPYPTACRIVDTLIDEGYIARETARRHYRPTAMVNALSLGYQPEDALASAARPHIVGLTKALSWPVSVCSRVGMSMMVHDSTHALTPLTFNLYYSGYTLPLLHSSSGRVSMAFSSTEEQDSIFNGMAQLRPEMAQDSVTGLRAEFARIRADGYGTHERIRHTRNPGKTSAISVPVHAERRLAGTLTLVFFTSAMTLEAAIARFVAPLKQAAAAVSFDMTAAPIAEVS